MRPHIAQAVVAAAATVDASEGVAHMRYQRGSPLKVWTFCCLSSVYWVYFAITFLCRLLVPSLGRQNSHQNYPFTQVRRVLDQIRGRSYEEALMILEYMPYKACEPVIKTLLSAAANAKHNLGLKKKDLYVSECYANEGPVLKRFQPRAQGRANRILKPMVHITVKVAEKTA
jgi:large subunit ribosomal protein L22